MRKHASKENDRCRGHDQLESTKPFILFIGHHLSTHSNIDNALSFQVLFNTSIFANEL